MKVWLELYDFKVRNLGSKQIMASRDNKSMDREWSAAKLRGHRILQENPRWPDLNPINGA